MFRTAGKEWDFFKKYHYLSETVPMGHYYVLRLKNKDLGFICIARFPHPIAKDIMTISRVVIAPEFQGFGLGLKFMNSVADIYKGNRVRITTSLKPFICALNKSADWKCVRFGRVSRVGQTGMLYRAKKKEITSYNRITATFERTNNG